MNAARPYLPLGTWHLGQCVRMSDADRVRQALVAAGSVAVVNAVVEAISDVPVRPGETLHGLLVPSGERIDAGEYWRPLTSLVAHDGVAHVAINSALLFGIAPSAGKKLGLSRSGAAYVTGGFVANALRYVAGGRTGGGASGAVFALAGACVTVESSSDRRRQAGAACLALAAIGVVLARRHSDNHLLALAIGGGYGLVASEPVTSPRFAAVVGGATGAAAVMMVARRAVGA